MKKSELKKLAIAYKGGKCEVCGYDFCNAALEFHHIIEIDKEFNISSKHRFNDEFKKELDKCILVCCRCHREIHAGYISGYLDVGSIFDSS
jgi:5-methylcytosine-specific restriction endonuclease McrA